jgi:hypothetical protein
MRRRRGATITTAVVLAVLAVAAQAQAATFTVGTTSDTAGTCQTPAAGTCSLRQLIAYENATGSNDTIVVPAGSYPLTGGELSLTRSMTIAGAGARTTSVTQQTTSSTSRVFAIRPDPASGLAPTVTISGLAMSGGKSDRSNGFFGGNVLNLGILTLSEDSIENGMTSAGSGAGISNDGGTLTVTHSLVAFNGSPQTNDSGGIQNVGNGNTPAALTVIDSTIANNTSAQGGGIMSWSNAGNTARVVNSTITGNDGGARNTVGGGLLAADGGTISVENSIIAGNKVDTPNPGTPSNCGKSGSPAGTIKSLGYNLEGAADCGFTATGDLQNTDPQFASTGLQNNGGNTDTYALVFASRAVDHIPAGAADCGGTDQRDIARPQGTGCDVGAFEFTQTAAPVLTGAPPSVSTTGAVFSGAVNPDGLATTAFFQYGLDPKYTGGGPVVYTNTTPAQQVGSDFASHALSASVSSLVPNAVYHVRLVATNTIGTTFGPDTTFTTKAAPPPSQPTLGQTFNIAPVSGVVLVKINGAFVPLTQLRQIPQNVQINALHGTIQLITAIGVPAGARDVAAKGKKPKVKTQNGTFGGAIFKLQQTKSGADKGLVTLTIVENAFNGAPSYATCTSGKAADATAAALSSKTLQLLRANAKGKFTTRGKYAAATVRGTKWTTGDRCDGTLIHDITHSVAVTDFVRHKTIILHAGQSYLAKPKK